MSERDNYIFFDTSNLKETPGVRERATERYIKEALESRFPADSFSNIKVSINESGVYQAKASLSDRFWGYGKPVNGLPPYIEVEIFHSTGQHNEQLIVWSPLAWNDRFAGTAGGGISIGGREYLSAPDNLGRTWNVPS